MQLKIQPNYHTKITNYKGQNVKDNQITLSKLYTTQPKDKLTFGSKSFEKRAREKRGFINIEKCWFFTGKEKRDKIEGTELEEPMAKALESNDQNLRTQMTDTHDPKKHLEVMQELEANFKKQKHDQELAKKLEETNALVDEMYESCCNFNKPKGFGKIAGYENIKRMLIDHLGVPIALEKSGLPTAVPNGVLLFGPLGTGKTTLAKAFAEQLDCNLVQINPTFDFKTDFHNLVNTAKAAQKKFEKDKIRTIIQIDSFEVFAPKNSKIIAPLKNLMDQLSEKYHCTIFAITNFPEQLEPLLLVDHRLGVKVGLPPADKESAKAILKHYAGQFADEGVNYDVLAEELFKVQPNEAFSNARIMNVIRNCIQEKIFFANENKITQEHLLISIKEAGPDISKRVMELFKKQIEYIKHI